MTPNDLLISVMKNCNQYGVSGITNNSVTNDYKSILPYECDNAQRDLIQYCKYRLSKTENFERVDGTGYRSVPLPDNLLNIFAIYDSSGKNQIGNKKICYISGADLYVANAYQGELKIVYTPIGKISTMDDNFILDTSFFMAIVLYCSANLIKTDDLSMASFYWEQYNEQREMLRRNGASAIGKIHNVY